MAGGKAFKSNVRERREAERRMKALEKRLEIVPLMAGCGI